MSPGSNTVSYPAFAHIGLRENPGKNLNQVTCPDRESNPGHLVSWLDMLTVTPQAWILQPEDAGLGTSYKSLQRTQHECTPANRWIKTRDGLSVSEWKEAIKMIGQVSNVRAMPGRSQDGSQCRHCTEIETLPHILGFCQHGTLIRNTRHHAIRELIAKSLPSFTKKSTALEKMEILEGLLLMDIMPHGTTINSDAYVATLKKLQARLSRVRRHREKQDVLLLHDNAQPYVSHKTTDQIRKFG
ncbi:hypothetical protein ANN_10055 [Periplaneta americana]|uniref:Uncharacterized protein n=1 Tax=Periplaneta americana TaxID=6978 RepID=A0ABQ8TP16_PERAM|nr:hypothetical protein ANN_10055 [Periplaneta americana]